MTHDLWTNLNATIFDYLAKVTLGSLVEKQRAKEAAAKDSNVMQDKRESSPRAAASASSAL